MKDHPVDLSAIPDHEIPDWIRFEGEAALWWFLRSPSVGVGPYAKLDLGAGTTHANLFRIFGKVQTPKRSQVPYGAAAVPFGMDALNRAVAESEESKSDCSALRGLDQSVLLANPRVIEALRPGCEQIYDSYRQAWIEARRRMSGNAIELSNWEQHKVFMSGGESLLPLLVDSLRKHPEQRKPLSVMPLEQPSDLVRADHNILTSEELPFVTVAYGLSNTESLLPNPYCRAPG